MGFDGSYGWQCFDLVNVYWNHLYGHGLKGYGAKDIPYANNFNSEAKIYHNTPTFKAEPGDLVVFSGRFGGGYGDSYCLDLATPTMEVMLKALKFIKTE